MSDVEIDASGNLRSAEWDWRALYEYRGKDGKERWFDRSNVPKRPSARLVPCPMCGRKKRCDPKPVDSLFWFYGWSVECANLDCMVRFDPITGEMTASSLIDFYQRRMFEALALPAHLIDPDYVEEVTSFPVRRYDGACNLRDQVDALIYTWNHLHGSTLGPNEPARDRIIDRLMLPPGDP